MVNIISGSQNSITSVCWKPNSFAPMPLEHQHQQPVGGAHREQVHHDGLQRHHDGAEDQHQQHEAGAENEPEHDRRVVVDDAHAVDGLCRVPVHVCRGRRAVEGGRDVLPAQPLEGVTRLHAGVVALRRHGQQRPVAGGADLEHGRPEGRVLLKRSGQTLDAPLH